MATKCSECDGYRGDIMKCNCIKYLKKGVKVYFGTSYYFSNLKCYVCYGRGYYIRNPCSHCHGDGYTQKQEKHELNLAKGINVDTSMIKE